MHKKVLVIGSLNMDLVVRIDRFHNEGETVLGNGFQQLIGGKGANQSSAAAAQGVLTAMCGFVGQDSFGEFIITKIKSLAIRSFVRKTRNDTGTALIETDASGKNRIIVVAGANGEFSPDEAEKQSAILDDFDIIVLQFEIPIPTIEYIIHEAKKKNKTVIVNPAPALPVSDQLFCHIDYIIPNEHELAVITGHSVDSPEQIQEATRILHEKGAPNIIVTLGEKGIYISTKERWEFQPCCAVEPTDTTGAGDAFVGGFAGALARGMDIFDAACHAQKVAAISVTKTGAFNSAGTYEEARKLK